MCATHVVADQVKTVENDSIDSRQFDVKTPLMAP